MWVFLPASPGSLRLNAWTVGMWHGEFGLRASRPKWAWITYQGKKVELALWATQRRKETPYRQGLDSVLCLSPQLCNGYLKNNLLYFSQRPPEGALSPVSLRKGTN